jgi:hypothetical protein
MAICVYKVLAFIPNTKNRFNVQNSVGYEEMQSVFHSTIVFIYKCMQNV